MKNLRLLNISLIILFFSVAGRAQQASPASDIGKYALHLKSGIVNAVPNLDDYLKTVQLNEAEIADGRYYRIIQFNSIPDKQQRTAMHAAGIELMDYLPDYCFVASIKKDADINSLRSFGIRFITRIENRYKLSASLTNKNYPAHALVEKGSIDLSMIYFSDLSSEFVLQGLKKNNIRVLSQNIFTHNIKVRVFLNAIVQTSSLPFIFYLEPVEATPQPENLVERTDHRSNVLATDYFSGRHYDGTGVSIALGDDGIIGPHIDYTGRVDQSHVSANNGNHGDHVAGIIIGGGNLDPKTRGMAFGANLFMYNVYDNIDSIPNTYYSENIRITSTSYSEGCNDGYTAGAQQVDQQVRLYPSLMHVFSAGNSGTSDCGYGAGAGWGNITGGRKLGKNVIAVADLDYNDQLNSSSSRGPASDGRIKPDVAAVGTNVYSTLDTNSYGFKSGTSMSCPGVSGTFAQLIQAYRVLNGNSDPESALIKACLMNTAEDLGNAGPDFEYGYGRINAARAVQTIEQSNYLSSSISQGGNNTYTITVPSGTQRLRVMIYWTDYEASVMANTTLVNDIDMYLTDPSSTDYYPWILDPTPNAVNLSTPATRGIDHLNNAEQVTIDNPSAGTYTLNVSGFLIPQGPQTYYVVYELEDDAITVTYPIGGEGFSYGETETIRWDAYGNSGTFDTDYSTNNGSSWTSLATALSGTTRSHDWVVDSVVTGHALVRVSRGAVNDVSDAQFTIMDVPEGLHVAWACSDSIRLEWSAVPGANSYDVFMLGNQYMDSVTTITSIANQFYGLNPLNEYWFSVRARSTNGAVSRRAIAIKKNPGTFNCSLPQDIQMDAILNPLVGINNNCSASISNSVKIDIENAGPVAISNIPLNYQLNGGPVVTETYSGSIASGAMVPYTFSATIDISANGNYDLQVWTSLAGDPNHFNDTMNVNFQMETAPVTTLPWIEDFETFTLCSTASDCGLTVCTFAKDWTNKVNGAQDDIDWRTNSGDTPTNFTGPSADHTLGNANGKYLYLEASGPCIYKEADMSSPCLDLGTAASPKLSFWYNMYGSAMGELHVDILDGGIWTQDVMPVLFGNHGNTWFEQVIDLSAFATHTINIRFRGITGYDFTSDLAVDDISISEFTGIPEGENSNWSFGIYPNPASGALTVQALSSIQKIDHIIVRNMMGQTVSEVIPSVASNIVDLNVQNLPSGIYSIEARSGDASFFKKFSKISE